MKDDLRTYVDLYVEILQVKGVFPNVNTDDRDVGEKRILIGCGDNLQFTTGWVEALMITSSQPRHLMKPRPFGGVHGSETYEPAPARTLNASSSRVEFFLQVIYRTPALADGSLQWAILENAAVTLAFGRRGREVLPEERVVDVACRHTRDIR